MADVAQREAVHTLLTDTISVATRHLFRVPPPAQGAAAAHSPSPTEHVPTALTALLVGDGVASAAEVGERIGGFACVLSRCCPSPSAELARFKRSMQIVGRFAHSLHAAVGAPVRGVQGEVIRKERREESRVEPLV